jgi:hypothetical protein
LATSPSSNCRRRAGGGQGRQRLGGGSVKAASDVYAPVSGTVSEANAALEDEPELVNTAAESDGWLWRMTLSDAAELGPDGRSRLQDLRRGALTGCAIFPERE